jgi:hypothetical protein
MICIAFRRDRQFANQATFGCWGVIDPPTRPVHTFWDIGMDDEIQGDGVRRRLIDF